MQVDETLTVKEASAKLDELALDCEDENYHFKADMLWKAMDLIQQAKEPVILIVPGMYDETHVFRIIPKGFIRNAS